MKIQVVLFVVCVVAWTEGFRTARKAEESTDSVSTPSPLAPKDPCCYPRPPQKPRSRGLSKQTKKCCEFPVAEIYEKFYEDLNTCKENRKKEQAEKTSTTTDATTNSAVTEDTTTAEEDPASNESDAVFDALEPDETEFELKEKEVEVTTTSAQPEKEGKQGSRHGGKRDKGKCGKHHGGHGCGKCIKEAMEKQGWSENGTINWDAILKSTQEVSGKQADEWRTAVTGAIATCGKIPTPTTDGLQGKHHGKHHARCVSPEKHAWRCMVNNAIMKCPNFPENNEYCVQLREAHDKCMKEGAGQFHWCRRNSGDKPKM